MKLFTFATVFSLSLAAQAIAEATPIDVKKTNGCGCCLAWMDHLEENGFAPSGQDMFAGLLVRFKLDSGVPQRMVSCHTGLIDGYVIEGHVPADDIRRLLSERPDAVGLAVPGMPLGSPGMDQSRWREAYDVFLINNDGTTEVFASYPGD
ncbi:MULTISPECIES: DUF411 domain-containing protein [Rhodobacterales]|jgi:hypothetical protein|uniref:Metal-binding protein n=2 Tax=Rhodobacterales TaxID=204455 RepID=A0A238JKI3_9RHOB|nr:MULTISPECIES: DUF411 domain-containing protein [Rhodobacterales]TDS88663.1 hypothetical protein CLV87_4475 [Pelagimonas phthalicica]CUJ43237.1 Protein of unknown function, DUF [Cognatishimia activa]CUK25124.1 Protein of unknown function, DUF [Cognatishimia activa]SMX30442.1 hypothetical protein TRP8649_04586 [Pelagimonas phthalicica]